MWRITLDAARAAVPAAEASPSEAELLAGPVMRSWSTTTYSGETVDDDPDEDGQDHHRSMPRAREGAE